MKAYFNLVKGCFIKTKGCLRKIKQPFVTADANISATNQ
jgi:hypothetical protein